MALSCSAILLYTCALFLTVEWGYGYSMANEQFAQGFNLAEDAVVTEQVYLDIAIGEDDPKRVVIGLFGAMTPKTVRNFVALANHEVSQGDLERVEKNWGELWFHGLGVLFCV